MTTRRTNESTTTAVRGWKRFGAVAWTLAAAALFSAAGCTSGGSGGSLLAPAGSHRNSLSPTAEDFRKLAPIPQTMARELEKQLQPAHVVAVGDTLEVTVFPDLDDETAADQGVAGDHPVQTDGTIPLGTFGSVAAAGQTTDQLQEYLAKLVFEKSKKKGKVAVRLSTNGSRFYYVLGAVTRPGAYPLTGDETVLDGILQAGGLDLAASEHRIIVSRPSHPCDCRTVLPVCYQDITQLGDVSTNYQLLPGDRIFVARHNFWEGLFPGLVKRCPPCSNVHSLCPIDPLRCGGASCCPTGCSTVVTPYAPGYAPTVAAPGVLSPPTAPAARDGAGMAPGPLPSTLTETAVLDDAATEIK
ncbi:MAG: polysaccharide biosynthesis/export family protein [Planctomycetia bacterium]